MPKLWGYAGHVSLEYSYPSGYSRYQRLSRKLNFPHVEAYNTITQEAAPLLQGGINGSKIPVSSGSSLNSSKSSSGRRRMHVLGATILHATGDPNFSDSSHFLGAARIHMMQNILAIQKNKIWIQTLEGQNLLQACGTVEAENCCFWNLLQAFFVNIVLVLVFGV